MLMILHLLKKVKVYTNAKTINKMKDFAIRGNEERIKEFLETANSLGWKSQGTEDFPEVYNTIMFNCDKETGDTDGLKYGHYWSTNYDGGIYNIDSLEGFAKAIKRAEEGLK